MAAAVKKKKFTIYMDAETQAIIENIHPSFRSRIVQVLIQEAGAQGRIEAMVRETLESIMAFSPALRQVPPAAPRQDEAAATRNEVPLDEAAANDSGDYPGEDNTFSAPPTGVVAFAPVSEPEQPVLSLQDVMMGRVKL